MSEARTRVAALVFLVLGCGACSSALGPAGGWTPRASEPTLTDQPGSELEEPQGLVAISGELRAIPLKWEPLLVGEVGGYVIERSAERAGPFQRLATVSGRMSTRYLDRETLRPAASRADVEHPEIPPTIPTNLEDGITWFYRVRAYSTAGSLATDPSATVAATTAPPLSAPEELRAYSRQPRKVPLSWRASENRLVEGYWVYRSPSAAGPYQLITRLQGRYETTYVDSGLGDLRVFYYRVTATNRAGGVGEPTPAVQAVTKPEPLPPFQLRATEQRLGSNTLSWEPNVEPDIAEYRVLRTRSHAEMPEIVASVSSDRTFIEDRAVGAGEHISYSIVAIDRDGLESKPAEPIVVVGVDYGLEASSDRDGVRLSWDASGEPFRGGHVYRHEQIRRRSLGFTTEGHFVDPAVLPGQRYRYSVVLERPDETLAPPSPVIEIAVPEAERADGRSDGPSQ